MRTTVFMAFIFFIFLCGCTTQPDGGGTTAIQATTQSVTQTPAVTVTRATTTTAAETFEESQFGIAISDFGSEYLTRMPEDLLGTGSHWAGSLIIRWRDVEPVQGEYDWDELDYYLVEAGDEINLLLELRLFNDWASEGGCSEALAGFPLKDGYSDELENFLRLLVQRAGEKVDYYSIGNEMEISQFWCCTHCVTEEQSAAEYLEILEQACTVIKQENPEAVILLGGFTGNWKGGTNTNPGFVEYVLANGKDYFDVLDVHLYGEPETYGERVGWFVDLMDGYGYSKPIWSTEMGGPDIRLCFDSGSVSRDGGWETLLTEDECARVFHLPKYRAEFYAMHSAEVVKRYIYAFDAGLEKSFWWKLYGVKEYQIFDGNYSNHVVFGKMGLVATESGGRGVGIIGYLKTPAYYTYEIMVEELDMFDSIERLTIGEADAFLFDADGESVVVAWSDDGATVYLGEWFDGDVRVRHIVSELDGQDNPVYADDEYVDSSAVVIGSQPVFIRQ